MITVPRWPSTSVIVDDRAYQALGRADSALPSGIRLILTRGYEPWNSRLGWLRKLSRVAGVLAFLILFPHRYREIGEIFGANGHDVDGNHLDIAIQLDGKRLRFLPLSVFTPHWMQRRRRQRYGEIVGCVHAALIAAGFRIHPNHTESLQIHCDFVGGEEAFDRPPACGAH